MTAADPEGRVRHLLDVMHKTFDAAGDPIPAGFVPITDGLGQVDYIDSSTFSGGGPGSPEELAYAENTAGPFSVTATTESGGNTIVTAGAVTLDGSTAVVIEWGAASLIPPVGYGLWINMILFDNGSSIGILGGAENDNNSSGTMTGSIHAPVHQQRRLSPPSAGSHTYSIRAFVASGTGTINAGTGGSGSDMPAYIRVIAATTPSGGAALTIKDEGTTLDTAVTSIDFVGAGVTATNVSHAVTVTIPGSTAPDTSTFGLHVHVAGETHLSNGSATTYTLDQAFEPGSVIAWNTTTLARLGVTETAPDQATVSAAGSSGDSIVFDYAATLAA